jgi:hypothetical protein
MLGGLNYIPDPLVPEPSSFEGVIAMGSWKGFDRIPAETFKQDLKLITQVPFPI